MTLPAPPEVDASGAAFLFDIDGTLADIASTPDRVSIPSQTRAQLQRLSGITRGAVGIVSGRPIAEIDRLLSPLRVIAAGIHGAERRGSDGVVHRISPDPARLSEVSRALRQAADTLPGVLFEDKGIAFALHYRNAPAFEPLARKLVNELAQRYDDLLTLQIGKMVFELKPHGASKGEVLHALLHDPALSGRRPVFAGDDVTDESAFAAVHALDGVSIKVGTGKTAAQYRVPTVAALVDWLAQLQ
jgi:trehalose 6-phosphate phosphatase